MTLMGAVQTDISDSIRPMIGRYYTHQIHERTVKVNTQIVELIPPGISRLVNVIRRDNAIAAV